MILTGVRDGGKAASPPPVAPFCRKPDFFLVTLLPTVLSNTHSLTRNPKIRKIPTPPKGAAGPSSKWLAP